jgi:hypothetical protein
MWSAMKGGHVATNNADFWLNIPFWRFWASATNWTRTALFWVVTQRVVEITYRRFGTTYPSHLQGSRSWNCSMISEYCTNVCACACACMRVNVRACVCVNACVCACVWMCVRARARVCVNVCVCVCSSLDVVVAINSRMMKETRHVISLGMGEIGKSRIV